MGITPEEEDRALFTTYGGPIEVEMVPAFQQPNPALFLVKAFFERNTEIITVFSGRRARQTDHLRRTLAAMDTLAKQQAAKNATGGSGAQLRLPVQIKGAWQHRYVPNDKGEDVKIIQLIAGRWSFKDLRGEAYQFGEAPAFDVNARRGKRSYMLEKREIDAIPRSPRFGGAGE